MEPEQERRHDPEVAAAAADRPEEVRVALGVGRDQLARRKNDVRLDQAVDREAVVATQIADAAPRSGRRSRSCRRCQSGAQAEGMRRVIDVGEDAAGLDAGRSSDGVDPNALELPEVDDQPVVASSRSRPRGGRRPERRSAGRAPSEPTAALTSPASTGSGDQRGSSVDRAVVDPPGIFVVRVVRPDERAAEGGPKLGRTAASSIRLPDTTVAMSDPSIPRCRGSLHSRRSQSVRGPSSLRSSCRWARGARPPPTAPARSDSGSRRGASPGGRGDRDVAERC